MDLRHPTGLLEDMVLEPMEIEITRGKGMEKDDEISRIRIDTMFIVMVNQGTKM